MGEVLVVITVNILINGKTIFTRSARNMGKAQADLHRYKTDAGVILYHLRDEGAVRLAVKMLETIKEP